MKLEWCSGYLWLSGGTLLLARVRRTLSCVNVYLYDSSLQIRYQYLWLHLTGQDRYSSSPLLQCVIRGLPDLYYVPCYWSFQHGQWRPIIDAAWDILGSLCWVRTLKYPPTSPGMCLDHNGHKDLWPSVIMSVLCRCTQSTHIKRKRSWYVDVYPPDMYVQIFDHATVSTLKNTSLFWVYHYMIVSDHSNAINDSVNFLRILKPVLTYVLSVSFAGESVTVLWCI